MTEANSETIQPFYWDRYRDNTLDRYLLQRELSFIRRFVEGATPAGHLLEVGCGSGRVSLPLHAAGHRVIGIDKDAGALATFAKRSNAFPLLEGDGQHLPFAGGSFDYVVAVQCFHYFEHRRFLQECHRILRDSGLLIFQSLNRCSYKGTLKGLLGGSNGIGPSGALLSSLEVMHLISKCNFDIQAVSGYNWVPLTRSSNSALVSAAALLEKTFKLHRLYSISPWILVSARKKNLFESSTLGDQ